MTTAQGSISWFEIASSQPDDAQEFYAELFGWRMTPSQSAGFDYRHIDTGAAGALRGGLMGAADGMPPHAIFVVYVDDVAASASAAVAAGGVLQTGPITTETGLVCAYLRDPEGSLFAVMTPPGAGDGPVGAAPAAGSIGWFEVGVADADAAEAFYGRLFGWSTERFPDPTMDYRIVTTGAGHGLQGGITSTDGRRPSYAIVSVVVADVDETCRRAEELGGKVSAGPNRPEHGPPNAYLLDRDGNEFGIFTPPNL